MHSESNKVLNFDLDSLIFLSASPSKATVDLPPLRIPLAFGCSVIYSLTHQRLFV